MQWIESTLHDVRFALRNWRKKPGFTLAATATLALGIGANTAIFSVVSGVLLRPLPFANPEQLVQLEEANPTDPRLPGRHLLHRDLEGWRSSASLQGAVTYSNSSLNFQDAETEQVQTTRTERGLFRLLGVEAMLGRTFEPADPTDVAVVSAGFWRRLGGESAAIGRRITLDGQPYTVIGVMPEGFHFPYRATPIEIWTPWTLSANPNPNARLDAAIGRLRPGVTVAAAQNDLSLIAGQMAPGRVAVITPLADALSATVRDSLLVLLGAVALVLLVACANVANLLLARAAARGREVAVRLALGAGRRRLVRQFLTESLLLACAGGLTGLALGRIGSFVLLGMVAAQIPRASEIGFDWRVFAFLLLVTVATGIGFGIAPALAAARTDLQRGLKPGERGSAGRGRLRDGLVVAEVALAFILLAGAGLFLRTFLNLQGTPIGLRTENVLTLHMVVAGGEESHALEERVARIPGVRAAGFISLLPLQNSNWSGRFTVEGRPGEGGAEFRYVTPGYFRAMSIPIVRGRNLSERDTSAVPRVLLINEAFARQYFPNEDPVGRVLHDRGTIVGVAGDVRQSRIDRPPAPEIYYPVAQNFAQIRSIGSTMVVSSHVPPESLTRAVRQAIREVNRNLAIFRVKTMEQVVDDALANHRLYVWLLGLFAALGTLLAAMGVYSVIAYLVTLRTQEFGIRMALGAGSGSVLLLVMRRGGTLVAAGIAIGFAGAAVLTGFLKGVLYGVGRIDPLTFALMTLLLSTVALVACIVPARRAARVDPAIALRAE